MRTLVGRRHRVARHPRHRRLRPPHRRSLSHLPTYRTTLASLYPHVHSLAVTTTTRTAIRSIHSTPARKVPSSPSRRLRQRPTGHVCQHSGRTRPHQSAAHLTVGPGPGLAAHRSTAHRGLLWSRQCRAGSDKTAARNGQSSAATTASARHPCAPARRPSGSAGSPTPQQANVSSIPFMSYQSQNR